MPSSAVMRMFESEAALAGSSYMSHLSELVLNIENLSVLLLLALYKPIYFNNFISPGPI
jgi:hypothetical protein